MDSHEAKRSRLPLQLILGIAIGGIATAAVIVGVSSLTNEKGSFSDDGRSIATKGNSVGASSGTENIDTSPLKGSPDEGPLSGLLSHRGNFGLSVALHNTLASAGEKELLSLLEQSAAIDHASRRQLVQGTIFRRYASLDPKGAVKQVSNMPRLQHGDLLATVFGEWALAHLDDAVANAKRLDGFGKLAALRGILESRDDLADAVRIEIGRQLGNERVAQNIVTQSNISVAIKDPESAWDTLIGDDLLDTAQTGTLIQVAEAWIEKDGMSVLGKINDTLSDWTSKTSVLAAVIHNLVQTDAQAVFDFVRTLENDTHNTVIMNVVNAWARLDPEAALAAVQSVESKSLRSSLQNSIASSWGRTNPREALANLELLPESARKAAMSSAIIALAQTTPEEAANLMANMDGGEYQLMTAFQVMSAWANKDPMAALEWILNNPDIEDQRTALLPSILYQVASRNPQLAFEIALQQPVGENQIGLEAQVIANIAYSDMEKALALLSQVREGPTLVYALNSVGSALVRSGDVDEAWMLAQRLPKSQRQTYFQNVVSAWALQDATELYESIDGLPSDEIKSFAAARLISFNKWSKNLDDDQVNRAKTYLNERDANSIEQTSQSVGHRVGAEFMHLGGAAVSGSVIFVDATESEDSE